MTTVPVYSREPAAVLRAKPKAELDQHDPLTESAEKLVAQTFFGTLLRQARQSPFHSKIMDGGHGGQAFGEMLDQRLSEHMTRGAGAKLVQSLMHRLRRQPEYKGMFNKGKKSTSAGMLGNALRTQG
jgi:Rod binding domain-containing protein